LTEALGRDVSAESFAPINHIALSRPERGHKKGHNESTPICALSVSA